MAQTSQRQPPLTQDQADDLFMLMMADDTEDAPWMVMGGLQFWSASGFAHSLRIYARERGLGWFVAGMMPIEYRWPSAAGKKVLAPDTFVAMVADRSRDSFDATAEGGFPPFVLEVVSPSSRTRDRRDKRKAYDLVGVREYALFTPRRVDGEVRGELDGYQRNASGRFVEWPADDQGRLWSNVLGLFLVARGPYLQAQTADGQWLLLPEQAAEAQRSAEHALHDAEKARGAAEAEAELLRAELERYRRASEPTA